MRAMIEREQQVMPEQFNAGDSRTEHQLTGSVDPQTPGTITGYQPQSPEAVEAVNACKSIENALGEFIETLKSSGDGFVDRHWLAIGVTQLQQGFMAINRAIFQPDSKLKP